MIVHVPLFHTSVFYNTRTKYVYLKRANWVHRLYAYWVMGLQVFSSSCIYILSKMNMCLEAIPYHQSEQLRAWSYYTAGRNAWHDFVPKLIGSTAGIPINMHHSLVLVLLYRELYSKVNDL